MISTYAGNGKLGGSGTATGVAVSTATTPSGIAVDPSGNLYIVDMRTATLWKVATDGSIHRVSFLPRTSPDGGSGLAFSPQQVPVAVAPDASIYVALASWVYRVDSGTAEVWQPVSAFSIPIGAPAFNAIAFDSAGTFYAALNYPVTELLSLSNGNVARYLHLGDLGMSTNDGPADKSETSPTGLALDGSGNIFITDSLSSRVRVIPVCQAPSLQ
jgi:sugar lactone lactonase YvrE